MKCRNCGVNLLMTDRNGIEIDYCPDCRGVWLDRGELDKIIERASPNVQNGYPDRKISFKPTDYRYKKGKGLLGDLFDF